jgi:hypothetical protein
MIFKPAARYAPRLIRPRARARPRARKFTHITIWLRFHGQMWRVLVPKGLSDFVPAGLDDRSQAIHCLGLVQSRIRPVGHGLILIPG